MKATRIVLNLFMTAVLATALLAFPAPAHAAGTAFLVTSIADAVDVADLNGNGTCDLREAVEAANWVTDHPVGECPRGGSATDPTDTISFSIGASGSSHTITLYAPLTIVDDLIMDGTSQPGYAGSPLIRLDGNNTTSMGLFLNGPYITVKGLMLTRFVNQDIGLTDAGHATLQANYIGTDGSTDLTNAAYGIGITGSEYVLVGGPNAADRNIIAGHHSADIGLWSGGHHNTIQGNYIGLTAAGSAAVPLLLPLNDPDNNTGILLSPTGTGASYNLVTGNVISGHATGIINYGSTNNYNTFEENKIGTDASGVTAVANTTGIQLLGGDETHIYYNAISGNGTGIIVESGVAHTRIMGNQIGSGAAGMLALPNTGYGIRLNNAPAIIGEPGTPGYNYIAANGQAGIYLSGAGTVGTTIAGNKIGLKSDHTALFPNGSGAGSGGIHLTGNASAQVAGNWIAGNNNDGIFVETSGTVAAGSTNNCFTDSVDFAVKNTNTGVDLPLSGNWWGSNSGPHHPVNNPTGLGDEVSGHMDISSFLTMPPTACSALEGPLSVDFGDQLMKTIVWQTIQLTNNGTTGAPIPLVIQVDPPFSIDAASTCPTAGGDLAEYTSCNLVVNFTPAAAGMAVSNIHIYTVQDGEAFLIPLTGTGLAGTQLLVNTGFESDSNHDNMPDGWAYSNFAPAADGRDCAIHQAGACSIRLAGSGQLKQIKKTITQAGSAGDDFRFSLWSRSSAVPAGFTYRVQVKLYNGAMVILSKTLDFNTGTHTFQQVKGFFSAPGDYTKIVFKISFSAPSGRVWFDTASLKWAP